MDDSTESPADKITARNGTPVEIRPIREEDAPLLQAFVTRLSHRTMFFRFLGYMKRQSDEQAHRLATVDYDTRMAFVAIAKILFGPHEGEDQVIGVARYFPLESGEPGVAEIAVVVEDEYQGRGIGSQLLIRLLNFARDHGYTSIAATIHAENEQVMRFLRRSGLPLAMKLVEAGVYDVRIGLTGDLEAAILGKKTDA